MSALRFAAVVLLGVSVAGCATIIRGSKTDFNVQSDPPGAQVSLSTGETCPATPCKIRRPRKEVFTATVTKPGYKPSVTDVTHHWSKKGTTTGIVGNAILGGGIGIGVDAATGANQDLFPNPLILKLEPEGAAPAPSPSPAAAAPAAAAKPSAP